VNALALRLLPLNPRNFWIAIQELLGHKDVSTPMIYTHVLNKGGHGVRSPVDGLQVVLYSLYKPQQNKPYDDRYLFDINSI